MTIFNLKERIIQLLYYIVGPHPQYQRHVSPIVVVIFYQAEKKC